MNRKLQTILISSACFFSAVSFAAITEVTAPTDAQILEIVRSVNNAEISAGELAKKSKNKIVVKFADHMTIAHKDSNIAVKKISQKLDLPAQNSSTSEKLQLDTGNQFVELKKLSGADFDRTYVDDQVKDHALVLKNLDDTLIPSAKSTEVKALLKDTRTAVVAHLDHAKKVQSEIK